MNLPIPLIQSLQDVTGFDEKAFIAVHEGGEQVVSVRFNPAKSANTENDTNSEEDERLVESPTPHLPLATRVPWSSQGYYLSSRPSFTFDPLFHAGAYYVQEASSMFLEQAVRQTIDLAKPLRVLDLCAAPGGKSTLLQSVISSESLLVSNDVIKSRAAVLEENITKWGAANVVVTNNDPAHFARLENYFNLVVIDAPCSGSGLFRRDAAAIDEWSENNVQLCCQRQQRIIADVWPALQQQGVLIYSTCSYSPEEDEDMLDWLLETYDAESLLLKVNDNWNIVHTVSGKNRAHGYRFYPDKLKGEGFFIAAIKKKEGNHFVYPKAGKSSITKPGKQEEVIARDWLQKDANLLLLKQHDDILAMPAGMEKDIPVLQSSLYIKKAGINLGKLAGKDWVPHQQLAMSTIVSPNVSRIPLTEQQALQYLRKQDVQITTQQKGWALVSFEGFQLGWIKLLPNRINNYYPKEWRIIKQSL